MSKIKRFVFKWGIECVNYHNINTKWGKLPYSEIRKRNIGEYPEQPCTPNIASGNERYLTEHFAVYAHGERAELLLLLNGGSYALGQINIVGDVRCPGSFN